MSIKNIHLSQHAKEQLIRLKRVTKIQNWNILCRWAFCVSLEESSIPAPVKIVTDSSVEMKWEVFGGDYHEIYLALLKQRCRNDGFELNDELLANQFKLHLHRGIGYLVSKVSDKQINDISGLFNFSVSARIDR